MSFSRLLFITLIATKSLFGQVKNEVSPNIILIVADDLGYADLGTYGSKRIETPQLDKMAKEGLQLNQFYAASAVCTPTRVSILTGNYPLRYNVSQHFNDKEMYLDNTMLTIPKLLNSKGYNSMHIGKWHLGGLNEKHIQNRKESPPGPLQHGFDHYLTMLEDTLYRAPAMKEKRLYKDAGKYLVKDEKRLPPNNDHWTSLKFDAAKKYIEEQNNSKKTFFLNLWLDAPHAPYEYSTDSLIANYKHRTNGQDLLYRAMVSQIDKGVGEILALLKDLDIAQNTLVIFTSDNGPAFLGSSGIYKGRKTDFHEGGIRVPFIAWWPSKIAPNKISNSLANTIDLLPTFATISNSTIEEQHKIDGIDLSELFLKNIEVEERPTMFFQISNRYKNNWNYVNTIDEPIHPVANQIARKGDWKLLALEGEYIELYNLKEDPYERWNLLNQYPKIAEKLVTELRTWLNEPRKEKPY
ncbi:sulfatase-like hydrolase/transferase [Urechidicola sp. KH5]